MGSALKGLPHEFNCEAQDLGCARPPIWLHGAWTLTRNGACMGCLGGFFWRQKFIDWGRENINLRKTTRIYTRMTDCGVGRNRVVQLCILHKINLWRKQKGLSGDIFWERVSAGILIPRASLVAGLNQLTSPLFLTRFLTWDNHLFPNSSNPPSTGLPEKAWLGNSGESDCRTNASTPTSPLGAVESATSVYLPYPKDNVFATFCKTNNSKYKEKPWKG